MTARDGTSIQGLRAELARGGIAIKASPDFRKDVQALRDISTKSAMDLADFGQTRLNGQEVAIAHGASAEAVAASANGSFVLVGDPGSGKSAVINEVARTLQAQGSEVILLNWRQSSPRGSGLNSFEVGEFGAPGRMKLGTSMSLYVLCNFYPAALSRRAILGELRMPLHPIMQ